MLTDEFKQEFLSIIEERLIDLKKETEREFYTGKSRDVYRKLEWHKETIGTNLKWRAVLLRGRFATHE